MAFGFNEEEEGEEFQEAKNEGRYIIPMRPIERSDSEGDAPHGVFAGLSAKGDGVYTLSTGSRLAKEE